MMMTADSLDLSAVTPAVEVNQRSSRGHAHSTPNDAPESKDQLLKGDKSKPSKQPQTKSTTKQQLLQVRSMYCVLNKPIFILWLIV